MRVLVGVACVAIIAAVGYYFWGERLKATERETLRVSSRDTGLRDLYLLADATPEEAEKLERYCADFAAGHKIVTPREVSDRVAEACQSLGH